MLVSGYRWRAGTYTAAQVLPATYAIENFTAQTDMKSGVVWTRPNTAADKIRAAVTMAQALDGSQADYGGAEFTWTFPFWTPLMVNYVYTTMFSSAYYADATVRTWNRSTGLWEYYTATALWPTFETLRDLDTTGGGWRDFPIRFIKGTQIT